MTIGSGSDATIFIDANIFLNPVLRSGTESAACASFLKDADAGVFPTATSVIVLNEVLPRLIIASVVSSSGIAPEFVVHQINLPPELVRKARAVWEVMEDIRSIRSMKIYGISPATFERSLTIMQEWGLLGNDALHVACMEEHSIGTIATCDRYFFPGILSQNPQAG